MNGKPNNYITGDAKTLVVAEVLKENYGVIRHLYVHYLDNNVNTECQNFESCVAKSIDLIAERTDKCTSFNLITRKVQYTSWAEQN